MLPRRFVISVGSYDGVVAGWDSRKNPKLALDDKPQKDSRLSPTRGLPPTPSSTPLPLSFAIANHEGSVRVVSSSKSSGLMFSCGSGEKKTKHEACHDDHPEKPQPYFIPLSPSLPQTAPSVCMTSSCLWR